MKGFGIQLTWIAVANVALITSCSGGSPSELGPSCAAYLGEDGCCIKAAGDNASAIDACKTALDNYASAADVGPLEASCKAALDAAAAAGLCSSAGGGGSGGADGGADGGARDPSEACAGYLACVAKATPEAFPAALASYGPDSPCWSSSSTAPVCVTACRGALDTLRETSASVPDCLRCTTDGDCWSALPACNMAAMTCVACMTDAHCAGAAGGQHCKPEAHTCVPCVNDSQCASKICSDNKCVECNTDSQCPSHSCSEHTCQDGCFIDGAFKPLGLVNPANPCQSCQPAKTLSTWSDLPPGTLCSSGSVCVEATCKAGCTIDGAVYAPDAPNPTNPCEICQPALSRYNFTVLANGASCGAAASCSAGACIPEISTQKSGITTNLIAVWGSAKDDVFVVGASGTILHTSNSGATWTQQMSGTGFRLFNVGGSAKDDVFAVGASGTILHTSDSGATWTQQDSGTAATLYDVWSSSKSEVFLVGDGGTILHTTDGGAIWAPQVSGTANELSGVWGTSRNDIYAVGGGGIILHTNNGGATWTKQKSGTTGYLFELIGVSSGVETRVYTVGTAGLFTTSNGGAKWSGVSIGVDSTLYNVWTSSSPASVGSDLYVVGGGGIFGGSGIITHSTDWGLHWTDVLNSAPSALSGVWGSDSSDVYFVGNSGTILHHP